MNEPDARPILPESPSQKAERERATENVGTPGGSGSGSGSENDDGPRSDPAALDWMAGRDVIRLDRDVEERHRRAWDLRRRAMDSTVQGLLEQLSRFGAGNRVEGEGESSVEVPVWSDPDLPLDSGEAVPMPVVAALLRSARLVQDAALDRSDAARAEVRKHQELRDQERRAFRRELDDLRLEMTRQESRHVLDQKRWDNQRNALNNLVHRLLKELQEHPEAGADRNVMITEWQAVTQERDALQREQARLLDRSRQRESELVEQNRVRQEELDALRNEMDRLRDTHDRERQNWGRQEQAVEDLIRRLASRLPAGASANANLNQNANSTATLLPHQMTSVTEEVAGWNETPGDPEQPPRPGMRLGKCILARSVGQGGFGNVFLATHTVLNIPVAVKVLRSVSASDPQQSVRLAEFRSEARLLAQLNHPNVVRLWDYEDTGAWPYLVMEYVEGMTLLDLINQSGRIQWHRAIEIILQVAGGLRAAAELAMVHRDVKPSNILLTKDGVAKITDFGLAMFQPHGDAENFAKSSNASESRQGIARGTAAYMAPEQARNEPGLDHRADIYALGATFYHALTGLPPFSGGTRMELLIQQTQSDPVPVHLCVPEIPPAISNLIQKMMARAREHRLSTHNDVIQNLSYLRTLSYNPIPGPDVARTSNPISPAISLASAPSSDRFGTSPMRDAGNASDAGKLPPGSLLSTAKFTVPPPPFPVPAVKPITGPTTGSSGDSPLSPAPAPAEPRTAPDRPTRRTGIWKSWMGGFGNPGQPPSSG